MLKPTWERDGIALYLGDCLSVLPQLEAGSVDAVVTDPPYPQEFAYLWRPLAEQSARILKPGGHLFTLCGRNRPAR